MRLKAKYSVLLLQMVAFIVSGCSESSVDFASWQVSLADVNFKLSKNRLIFGSDEETATVSISTDGAWRLGEMPSWIEASPVSGVGSAEITVSVSKNESFDRVFVLRVSGAEDRNISRPIKISQRGRGAFAEFPAELNGEMPISAAAQEITIPINTNVPLDDIIVTMNSSYSSSVTYTLTSDGIILNIKQNGSGYVRNYKFSLKANQDQTTESLLIVKQQKPVMSMDVNEISNISVNGGEFLLKLESDVEWKASHDSWISVSPPNGSAGVTELTMSISESNNIGHRIGAVVFRDSGYHECLRLVVKQIGKNITLSKSRLSFPCNASSTTEISVDSGVPWSVSDKPDWISVSPDKGEAGVTVLNVSSENNGSIVSRTGNVFIKSTDGSIIKYFTCEQDGQYYGTDCEELKFDWRSGSLPVNLTINSSWSCATSDSWISVSTYSGSGNAELVVSVEKNTESDTRTGYVAITSDGEPITVPVIQSGQFFYLESTSGNVGASGGAAQLKLSSSIDVAERISYKSGNGTWVDYSKQDDGLYELTASYNNSINSREAEFVIEAAEDGVNEEYKHGLVYVLTQSGRQLSVSVSQIDVGHDGGTTERYNVNHDGDCYIYKEPNDTWYTLSYSNDKTAISLFVTENKTGKARKGMITIGLSGLPDGESSVLKLPVCQYGETSVDVTIDGGYGEDKDWNL